MRYTMNSSLVTIVHSSIMKFEILQKRAINLRFNGYSFREIGEILKISKSTASLWTRDVVLSEKAKKRIEELSIKGRIQGAATVARRILLEELEIRKRIASELEGIDKFSPNLKKISCALLYWAEGSKKDKSRVAFINSDPLMIKFFLKLFRESFKIDEEKFRAMIHIHSYHNEITQLNFWSDITGIPISRFSKSYRKINGGKIINAGYQGCISVRYYDKKIYKELMFICEELMKHAGVV